VKLEIARAPRRNSISAEALFAPATGADFAPGYPVILEARDGPPAAQEFDQRRSPFALDSGWLFWAFALN
jgi:hypothetical protein